MQTAVDLAASPNPFVTKGTDFDTALACAMAAKTVTSQLIMVYQLTNGRWTWSRLLFVRHSVEKIRCAFVLWDDYGLSALNKREL